MNYDFAMISNVSKELQNFLERPTDCHNLTLLFNPPPENETVYMCLIQRRFQGWLNTEYYDLLLQLGGTNTYVITARRKECGVKTVLKYSLPHDLHNTTPFRGRNLGMDRLSIGNVRSNSFNTHFYADIDPELQSYLSDKEYIDNNEVLVRYKTNLMRSWRPYEMEVFLAEKFCYSNNRRSSLVEPSIYVLKSRYPEYDPFMRTYVMDFKNRVTIPSIKNFQLEDNKKNVILQFGRVGKNVFTMDFKSPLSLFQAFSISLTRFYL